MALAAGCAAAGADGPVETVLVYRMRGEVRPLLFWLGRDDVGGGKISIRSSSPTPETGREEFEILFGSDPDRIPRRINRWGYGREIAEWSRPGEAPARLVRTEFQGFMPHSAEASLAEVKAEKSGSATAKTYDVTRSTVVPERSNYSLWVFADSEDFHYRHPERLLAKYRETLAKATPALQGELANEPAKWSEPYGFLSLVSRMTRDAAGGKSGRHSATFVYNAKPYTLTVSGVKRAAVYKARHGGVQLRDLAVVEFQCLNTVKRTRTDFTIWTPTTGDLKGLPVRILFQPKWWLRLDLDLDRAASKIQ